MLLFLSLYILQDGQSPLHDAGSNNHIEMAQLLLASGADVNVKEKVIWYTITLRYIILLLLFLSLYILQYGQSPLHDAGSNNHVEMAQLLLASGADVNIKDKVI